MKKYKACKRVIIGFLILYVLGSYALTFAGGLLYDFVPQRILGVVFIIAFLLWALIGFFAVIIMPVYIIRSRYEVSDKELHIKKGIFMIKSQYIPIRSVMSVTVVTTPLSIITGMNFVVLNSLGAKSLIPFIRRRDAREILETVNLAIRKSVSEKEKGDRQ